MKTDDTGSTYSGLSFDSHVSSYLEVTVAVEDENDDIISQLPDPTENNADAMVTIGNHADTSAQKSRARCDTDDTHFTLILKPNLDRDVSGLTECLGFSSPAMGSIPQSPAFGHSSDLHWRPKRVQRKDSGFDLVVSNHSIPMSTLTMMDFASEACSTNGSSPVKPHQFDSSVQRKWLSSTPRNVDTPILEDEVSEDISFGCDQTLSPSPPVSLTTLKQSRDTKKQESRKSESKQTKKRSSTKSKVSRKSGSSKTKVSKSIVVKKEGSAHSSGSKSSSKRSSAGKRTSAKATASASEGLNDSSESKSKSLKSKKKKSLTGSITKSPTRKEERDQPISPKKSKTKETKQEDPCTPDSKNSKKEVKRKSKSREARQDDELSPTKSKPSSEKRVSVSPKTRNSDTRSSTTTPKPRKSKTMSSKTATRRVSIGKTKSSSGESKDPPGVSLIINNRQVPVIPIKPSIVTLQTSDSSSLSLNDCKWWSLSSSSLFSTTESTHSHGKNIISSDPYKSPSMFGKLRRSTIMGRAR